MAGNRNHHHERTGQFLSNAAIRGFAVRPHPPVTHPEAPLALPPAVPPGPAPVQPRQQPQQQPQPAPRARR